MHGVVKAGGVEKPAHPSLGYIVLVSLVILKSIGHKGRVCCSGLFLPKFQLKLNVHIGVTLCYCIYIFHLCSHSQNKVCHLYSICGVAHNSGCTKQVHCGIDIFDVFRSDDFM